MSKYELSKRSGVPQSTISDICSNKTDVKKSSVETLYKICSCLQISIEDFLTKEYDDVDLKEFENFKSSVCHFYKNTNVKDFIEYIEKSGEIGKYYKNKQFAKSFYLLAFLDYVCDKNNIPRNGAYDFYRGFSLLVPIYPEGVILQEKVTKNNKYKKRAFMNSIVQFKKFNIIEGDVENVV